VNFFTDDLSGLPYKLRDTVSLNGLAGTVDGIGIRHIEFRGTYHPYLVLLIRWKDGTRSELGGNELYQLLEEDD